MTKILIIEDDRVVSAIYKRKLEDAGFAVEVCANGSDGFYRIHEAPFSAVLLDLMLPGMSGLDVIRKIRAQSRFQQIPIFILTNAFFDDAAAKAQEAGATEIFNKATTGPSALVEAIRKSVHGRTGSPISSGSEELSAKDVAAEPTDNPAEEAQREIKIASRILPELARTTEFSSRITLIMEMLRPVHNVANILAALGLQGAARLAFAAEALLKQLEARPECVNASTLKTFTNAFEFLEKSLSQEEISKNEKSSSINILAVDDDAISRQAIVKGLAKASLKCVAVKTPEMAESLLEENVFDLIILDVLMPGMDGFELCQRIRHSRSNSATPVLFVTSLGDWQSRNASVLHGGTDFIAKPFLPLELAVKALTQVSKANSLSS